MSTPTDLSNNNMLELNLMHKSYLKIYYHGIFYLNTLKSMLDIVTPAKE
jgi:hypothetical protein